MLCLDPSAAPTHSTRFMVIITRRRHVPHQVRESKWITQAEKNINGRNAPERPERGKITRELAIVMSKKTGMSPTLIQSQRIDVRYEMSKVRENEWKTVCMSEAGLFPSLHIEASIARLSIY